MVELLPLAVVNPVAVEGLLDAAFGADRFARTAYRIRQGHGAIAVLSFAIVDEGELLATIQCWPVAHRAAEGRVTPLVMVGPVAVRPDVQGGGYGRRLMEYMLGAAETAADGALMMIGDPAYYGRFFGFTAKETANWSLPGPFEPHRLLARATKFHAVPAFAGVIGPR